MSTHLQWEWNLKIVSEHGQQAHIKVGTYQFRLSGGGRSLIVDPPGGVWPVDGVPVGTIAVDVNGVEEVDRVVGCWLHSPAYQSCNIAKSAGEQVEQMREGVTGNCINEVQKHDW